MNELEISVKDASEVSGLLDVANRRRYQGEVLSNGVVFNEALLRKDEWLSLDATMIDIARDTLVAASDLTSSGLIHNLGGISAMQTQYERMSDMNAARVSMAAVTRDDDDALDFDLVSIPVPIVSKGFTLNLRRLEASRKMGESLDTSQVQTATRKVAEKVDDMIFNGVSSLTVDGNTIYGYTTHPDRNTGSASDFGTIANIYTTFSSMVGAAEADSFRGGPYVIYVPTTQYEQLRQIYTDGSGQSAMNRVMQNIPGIQAIRHSTSLADGNLVLVTMRRDVVDLAVAQEMTTVQWDENPFTANFKVMTAVVPRIKSDKDGKSGIVHFTGA